MIRSLLAALFVALPGLAAATEPLPPVEVMVLGSFHFANPGLDLVNAKVEDVRTPRRQSELAALATSLARFRPTRILVEREATRPDFEVADYRRFQPAHLTKQSDETAQIGYRLAHRLGHRAVYGFDEQAGPGEPNYFPLPAVEAYAKAAGPDEVGGLASLMGVVRGAVEEFEAMQPVTTVAQQLGRWNAPERVAIMHHYPYYGTLRIGDGDRQPGAELNAAWYLRNAKMFAKLTNIARPGDRVLVLVGAGHLYWLRHFARETPGYSDVDPLPYLR